jgi:hypothetical protein
MRGRFGHSSKLVLIAVPDNRNSRQSAQKEGHRDGERQSIQLLFPVAIPDRPVGHA